MAKCRNCGTDISDGAEYCERCLSKLNTAKDSESYLDDLLNAVMTEEPERREIVFPKRKASSLVSMPKEKEAPVEEAFDTFFDTKEELPDLKNYSIFGEVDEHTIDRMLEEEVSDGADWDSDNPAETEGMPVENEEPETLPEDSFPEEELPDFFADGTEEEKPSEFIAGGTEEEELPDFFAGGTEEKEELPDFFAGGTKEGESFPGNEGEGTEELFKESKDSPKTEVPEEIESKTSEETAMPAFDDFADLFADGEEVPASEQASDQTEQIMGDFSDLFAGLDETENGVFEFGAEQDAAERESGEEALSELIGKGPEPAEEPADERPKRKRKKKNAPGRFAALYHRIFDNVKVDPSKIKQPPTEEELEAKKREKQEAKARSKEEKEALLAEKKEQERQAKLEKQRAIKEAKEEKKARKLEEAKLLLEEMEKTRINRAGASIVFIFFAMIAVVIIVGTSIFSYSLSIRNAEYEFDRDEYTLAYNEIYGLEIKDEDILLYDRIMTVMYVQKQLNSYYNYYGMNDKPRALDSLLKGLRRYEKYIELAVELDVDSDLDSVRRKILTEISTIFSITEQEALEIIQSDSQVEYSKKVYDAVDRLE